MKRGLQIFSIFILIIITNAGFNLHAGDLALGDHVDTDAEGVMDSIAVPVAGDLSALTVPAEQQLKPIVLMYSAEDCEYCERMEQELIRPMIYSGELSTNTIFRKVMVDSLDKIKNFSGESVDPEQFAYKRGIQVTPTLQFVDSEGAELVPKLIGYQSTEMYSAYLDNAIGGSREVLQKR